jgi:fibronectin-binding autotransporter adhesin
MKMIRLNFSFCLFFVTDFDSLHFEIIRTKWPKGAECFLAIILLLLVPLSTKGATINWTGTSGDWSDPINWGGTEPSSSDSAYIANGGKAYISQLGEGCGSLYVGTSGTGKTGALDMTDGSLTTTKIFLGYYGIGTFTQLAGVNATNQLYIGYAASGTYYLSNSGQLTALTETIGTSTIAGLLQQSGGTNSANFLSIGTKGQYKLTGGTLLITSGLDNGGILDFENGPAVINAADNTIVNLARTGSMLKNTQATSLTLGANSLLIVPVGFDPKTNFANFSNAGITHTVGTTLTIAGGHAIAGQGTIDDPVVCQGTINAASTGSIHLMNGLILEGSGIANLGTGTLHVEDSSSGINGGSLSAIYQYIGGAGVGVFTHSAGINTNSRLYLGDAAGAYGTYNLSGSAILSTTDVMKVGHSGTGVFIQSGGTHTVSNGLYLGYYAGSSGTYTLTGGTLVLKSLSKGSGVATFNFGGGTLQASDNFSTSLPMTLTGTGGNANIDSAAYSVTFSGKLSGVGGINKWGSGGLLLTGANTYSGMTNINAGSLSISSTAALPGWDTPGKYRVAAGATLIVGDAVTGANTETMLGTGNFEAGSKIGFDVATAHTFDGSRLLANMGFAKSGVGLLTLSNALANTTGSITVSAGTLDLGGFTQETSGDITILGGTVQNGTLNKNGGNYEVHAGAISAILADGNNVAGLIINGSGTVTLGGANTFSGGVTLENGQLNLNNAYALGSTGGTIIIDGISNLDNTSGNAITLANNRPQAWNRDFTFIGSNNLNLGTGSITLGGNRQLTVSSKTLTVDGAINGNYSLTKAGNGALILTGSSEYTGGTFVNGGTLSLSSGNNRLSATSDITIAGGILDLGGGEQVTSGSIILQSGAVQNGTFKKTGGFYDVQSGTISASLSEEASMAGLIKTGNGLVNLTGINTYSGNTGINAGVLSIAATSALPGWDVSGRYTVAANATLMVADAVTAANVATMVGTGNFQPGSILGFDVTTTRAFNGNSLPPNVGLAKSGTGLLTLNSPLATTTGVIRVASGTLDLGGFAQETSGEVSFRGGTVQNGILKKNGGNFAAEAGTISAVLADGASPAGLIKNGSGTLTLSGSNTFSGGVTLNSGRLFITNAKALGSGIFTIGGTDSCEIYTETNSLSLANNPMIWNGSFIAAKGPSINFGAGPVLLKNNCTLICPSNTLTVEGVISGDYALTKDGGGYLNLFGNNTFTGGMYLKEGELRINNGQALGTGVFTIGNLNFRKLQNTSGACITLTNNNPIIFTKYAYLEFQGNDINLGTGPVSLLGDQVRINVYGTMQVTIGGAISGDGGIGLYDGVLSLTGNNTYRGGTYIDSGYLNGDNSGGHVVSYKTLQVASPSSLPGFNTTGHVIVKPRGMLVVKYGGTNDWTSDDVSLLRENASFEADAAIGFDTTNATTVATYANPINGAIGFAKYGSNNLTISGANTHSGITTVRGGTLTLANECALQNSALVYSNYGGILSFGTLKSAYFGDLQGNQNLMLTNIGGEAVNLIVSGNSNDFYGGYRGILSGSGSLTKVGTDTLTLWGDNTFTGGVLLRGGRLNLCDAMALGTGAFTIADSCTIGGYGSKSNNNPIVWNGDFNYNGSGLNLGTGLVTLGGNRQVTVDYSTLTIGGEIRGNFSLTKAGSGTLVLTGNSTYVGGTNLLTGTLSFANKALGSVGDITILGTSTLRWENNNSEDISSRIRLKDDIVVTFDTGSNTVLFHNTFGLNPSGVNSTASIYKIGSGTLVLCSANAYCGSMVIASGMLNIQNNQAVGTTAGGVTVNYGAAMELQHVAGIAIGAESLSINGSGISSNGALRNISGDNILGGTVTLGGDSCIQSDAGNLILNATNAITGNYNLSLQGAGNGMVNGIISTGSGTITKDGFGTWTLSGNNSYTGKTTIKRGALQAMNETSLPSDSLLCLDGGVFQNGNNSVVFSRALGTSGNKFQWTANGGGFSAGIGAMSVNVGGSGAALTWGSSVGSNLVGTLKLGSLTAANVTTFQNPVNLNGSNRTIQVDDNPVSTADYVVMAGAISSGSGTAGIVKTGAGILLLTGINTYNGGTTISGGTLALADTGTLASTIINVGSGATFDVSAKSGGFILDAGRTLKGSGTVIGDLTINGIHAPGSSPGIETIKGNYDMLGQLNIELAGTAAGTGYDQVLLPGGAANYNVFLSGMLNLNWTGMAGSTANSQLWIVKNDTYGTLSGTFSNYPNGAVLGTYNSRDWFLWYGADAATGHLTGGNDIVIAAVPEPSTLTLLSIIAIGLLGYLKRCRSHSYI